MRCRLTSYGALKQQNFVYFLEDTVDIGSALRFGSLGLGVLGLGV